MSLLIQEKHLDEWKTVTWRRHMRNAITVATGHLAHIHYGQDVRIIDSESGKVLVMLLGDGLLDLVEDDEK